MNKDIKITKRTLTISLIILSAIFLFLIIHYYQDSFYEILKPKNLNPLTGKAGEELPVPVPPPEGGCTNGQVIICGTNTGICSTGTKTCTNGAWGICIGSIGPEQEICNDGIDQDCDGSDLACACPSGSTQYCPTGQNGICEDGKRTCTDSLWGLCVPDNEPSTETCDDLDNDCDGLIDEENICDSQTCYDSDGGSNYLIKGTVTGAEENPLIDYCDLNFNNRLIEYSCTQNVFGNYYEIYTCPDICNKGACTQNIPQNETNSSIQTPSCYDNDPENNLYIGGYVEGVDTLGMSHIYEDECEGSDTTQIIQYSCYENLIESKLEIQQIRYPCPENYLCSEGVCTSLSQCRDFQDNLLINVEEACYNPITRQLEIALHKNTNKEISAIDFTIEIGTNTESFTCGYTCGTCEIKETGSTEYSITLSDTQKPDTLLLETLDCSTNKIDISYC